VSNETNAAAGQANDEHALEQYEEALKELSPFATTVVDRAIDNMTQKLVAGYRNKRNANPNSKTLDVGAETKEALKAASAKSAMEVANRGQDWKEMIQKSLSHGISSLSTLKLDGEFEIKDGRRPKNFKDVVPHGPAVYVVYNNQDQPVYVGDSKNMYNRWNAGHFNEFNQGEKSGVKPYKLAGEFKDGCVVKFIKMDSAEAAAALEAYLIRENFDKFPGIAKNSDNLTPEQAALRNEALEGGMLKNKKEELKTEQGIRSNQEAQKMKNASGSTATLIIGAGGEAIKNVGFNLVEQLTTVTIKGIKVELVDVLRGGKSTLMVRVKRLLKKIFDVLKGAVENVFGLLRGIAEFVVNALSKAIGQIYNLARNLFDLANGAWKLYKGAETMSREELARKVCETIVVSGSLVIWDALDAMLETWITAQSGGTLALFAPYLSAAVTAIGFGVTTHGLQAIVTRIIDAVIGFQLGYIESVEAERVACEQLIRVAESELDMLSHFGDYADTSVAVIEKMRYDTSVLSSHNPIKVLDLTALRIGHK
jgi:hypothetical protein